MDRKTKIIIVTVLIILLVVLFFPKQYIKGGLGGFIIGGVSAYKEEYSCLGFKQVYYPSGCSDCGNVYLCYGILYGKKCYVEEYNLTLSKEVTTCR